MCIRERKMDSINDARDYYQKDIIHYKIKTLLIDKEAKFKDTSVEDQMRAILNNLQMEYVNTNVEISEQKIGLARRMYSKLKKYKVVRFCVKMMKIVKRRMEKYVILHPIINLAKKILN